MSIKLSVKVIFFVVNGLFCNLASSCGGMPPQQPNENIKMGDYFRVVISGRTLIIPLPEELQVYMSNIVMQPGIHEKIEIQYMIPVGEFVLHGKTYRWYGNHEVYLAEKSILYPLPKFFDAGYAETEKLFPELIEFGIGGGSWNKDLPHAEKIEKAYKRFIPYLDKCVQQVEKSCRYSGKYRVVWSIEMHDRTDRYLRGAVDGCKPVRTAHLLNDPQSREAKVVRRFLG